MGLMMATTGAGRCSRKEAFSIVVPEPTDTYQPLSNEELVLMINKVAAIHGVKLTDEQLGTDLKGQRFFGVYTVEGFDFFGGKIKLTLGFCNSYNKSMSGRMCMGGEVTVCSNRHFYAFTDKATGINMMATHEHRKNIRDGLYQRINAAFASIDDFREQQEIFFGHLTERPLFQEDAYHLIVRAAQANVLNKTSILTVAEEYDFQHRGPDTEEEYKRRLWHPEFKPRTAYSLFQAFTEVQKDRLALNPVSTNLSTLGLTEFFHAEFTDK